MKKKILKIILISFLIKLMYVAFAVTYNKIQYPSSSFNYSSYISSLKKNDSFWYEHIANEGYSKVEKKEDLGFHDGPVFKQSEWAFFPFYPYLARLTAKITNTNIDFSFLLLSYFSSLLAFLVFFLFLSDYIRNSEKSLFITILLMVFPFHYYFSMFYTESLFLLLLTGGFYSLLRKQYILFALLTMPLVLLRPNGIIMLIPMYIFMLEQTGAVRKMSLDFHKLVSAKYLKLLAFFFPAVIIFIVYGIFQYNMTHEFFAISVAQKGWYRDFMFPLLAFFRSGDVATQFYSVYTIAFILLAIFSWKRLPLSFNTLILLNLILPLASGSVLSIQRFISVIFPFSIVIGNWIGTFRYKNLILILLFCVQLFTYYFWLAGGPLSY